MADRKIITLIEPTIKLDVMDIADFEYGTGDPSLSNKKFQLSKYQGQFSPFVIINGMKFSDEDIVSFSLKSSGDLPKLNITVKEKGGIFISKYFPKDGDVVSVYIKSEIKQFKPIRNDYIIIRVNSDISSDSHGEINTFSIYAILKVKDLYAEVLKSYSQKTSFDTLIDVAENLNLGFASNENETDDKMTRICPYDTFTKFISDVTDSAYGGDDSFYISFIDHYYYLNLVEINSLFTHDAEIDEAVTTFIAQTDILENDLSTIPEIKSLLYLTNSDNVDGTQNKIIGYTVLNNSGAISLKNGYKRFVQFYDKEKAEFVEHFIDPLTTENSEGMVVLKGRAGENDYQTQVKYKWVGEQYALPSGNVHPNYRYSILHNYQNNQEIRKMGLIVELSGINHNIYRYCVIPIFIINSKSQVRKNITQDADADKTLTGTMDKFLSGFYIVTEITFNYDSSTRSFNQRLTCLKREWGIPL